MFKSILLTTLISVASIAAPRPVLVELFTSEGCSSCPPADALLEKLDRLQPLAEIDVIVLSEHVDYWNHIGWKDPFSNPAFSRRQEQYARRFRLDSVYTPQLVIDGSSEIVGNQERSALQAITVAAKEPKVPIDVAVSATSVLVKTGILDVDNAVIMLASADSSPTISKVVRGENAGRDLKHVAVVRSLKEIGVTRKGQAVSLTVPLKDGPGNQRWIAFIQEREQGRILGVGNGVSRGAK